MTIRSVVPTRHRILFASAMLAAVLLTGCQGESPASGTQSDKVVTDNTPAATAQPASAPNVTAYQHMAVSATPLASEAGREILRAGGNAIDAAIAMQAVLTLVEPQSSGIGGGGFLLYSDAIGKQIQAYDGRETAPANVQPDLFLNDQGQPFDFHTAQIGGQSVGIPGVLRMLELAHRDHGRAQHRARITQHQNRRRF